MSDQFLQDIISVQTRPARFEFDTKPFEPGTVWGVQPRAAAPPASLCPPTTPDAFSIQWHAESSGLDMTDPANPTWDVTRTYTLSEFQWCVDFFGGCMPVTPTWAMSFSDAWCSAWSCPSGCTSGDGCVPNSDYGSWCEAINSGIWEYHQLATVEGHCSGAVWINIMLHPRFGTVNGLTGWHVATQLYGDVPNGVAGCTDDCCADTENSFNLFPSPTVNHYIGPTLNGTITIPLAVWTFTLTFSS